MALSVAEKLANRITTDPESYIVLSHHQADEYHKCPHWHAAHPKEMVPNNDIYKSSHTRLPTTFPNGAWKYRSDGITAIDHKPNF